MSSTGKLGLLGRISVFARDTASGALVVSAAAHIGAVAWFLSDGPIERSLSAAGGTTVIEVTLVEGSAAGASGEPGDNPKPAAARLASANAKEPEQDPDHAQHIAADQHEPPEQAVREREEEIAAIDPPPADVAPRPETKARDAPPTVDAAPVPPAKPAVPTDRTVAELRTEAVPAARHSSADVATSADRKTNAARLPSRSSRGGGTPTSTEGETRAAAPRANNPAPSYPRSSRRRGEEGKVILRVEVLANGRAGTVTVGRSSGFGRLDEAASDAVRRWRFHPAQRQGQPIATVVRIPVRFALNR